MSKHICPMYMLTPYIIISRVISSHMCPMYILKIHHQSTPTISTSQTTHDHQNRHVVFLIPGLGYFTFLYGHTTHNIHNRESGTKEEQIITGFGELRAQEGRSL